MLSDVFQINFDDPTAHLKPSLSLPESKSLQPIEWNQKKILLHPTWYQTEKIIHTIGKVFVLLGALTLVTSIVVLALPAKPIILAGAAIGALIGVSKIIAGIVLLLQDKFWNDPAYCLKKCQKAVEEFSSGHISYSRFIFNQKEVLERKLLTDEELSFAWRKCIENSRFDGFIANNPLKEVRNLLDNESKTLLKRKFLEAMFNRPKKFIGFYETPLGEWAEYLGVTAQELRPIYQQEIKKQLYTTFKLQHSINLIWKGEPVLTPEDLNFLGIKCCQAAVKQQKDLAAEEEQFKDLYTPIKRAYQFQQLIKRSINYIQFKNSGENVFEDLPQEKRTQIADRYLDALVNDNPGMKMLVSHYSEENQFFQISQSDLVKYTYNFEMRQSSINFQRFFEQNGLDLINSLQDEEKGLLLPKLKVAYFEMPFHAMVAVEYNEIRRLLDISDELIQETLKKDAEDCQFDYQKFVHKRGAESLAQDILPAEMRTQLIQSLKEFIKDCPTRELKEHSQALIATDLAGSEFLFEKWRSKTLAQIFQSSTDRDSFLEHYNLNLLPAIEVEKKFESEIQGFSSIEQLIHSPPAFLKAGLIKKESSKVKQLIIRYLRENLMKIFVLGGNDKSGLYGDKVYLTLKDNKLISEHIQSKVNTLESELKKNFEEFSKESKALLNVNQDEKTLEQANQALFENYEKKKKVSLQEFIVELEELQ